MVRQERKNETRAMEYAAYKPPSSLDVPDDLVTKYKNDGYHLRWIRFLANSQEDVQNITKRVREGWEFVTKSELPEEYREWFQTTKIRQNNQVICVGDLILAKIKRELAQARQRYFEGKSEEQVKAARQEAGKTSDRRMNTMVPVIDESESEVEITT